MPFNIYYNLTLGYRLYYKGSASTTYQISGVICHWLMKRLTLFGGMLESSYMVDTFISTHSYHSIVFANVSELTRNYPCSFFTQRAFRDKIWQL